MGKISNPPLVLRAINRTTSVELSDNVVVASTAAKRMKGLLGRDGLNTGESLFITPCKSIHTIAMSFPIDVLFLDSTGRVVALKESMPPNRVTWFVFKARNVLELAAGVIAKTSTKIGDEITFVESDDYVPSECP